LLSAPLREADRQHEPSAVARLSPDIGYIELCRACQYPLMLDGYPVRTSWRRIVGPVVVKEVTVVVKRSKFRVLKPHFG
jgi:hypothetical protein